MRTTIITNVTFDKSAKTVTFNDFSTIDQKRIVSVHNITRSTQIYSNKLAAFGGEVATNVLSLFFNTDQDNWADSDVLLAEYIVDNIEEVVAASASRTVTGESSTMINYGKGVMLMIDVTAVSGTTPVLVVRLQVYDPVSAQYIDLPDAATANITAIGQKVLTIYPGCEYSAGVRVPSTVPRRYRVKWDISGTTPDFTFSIGAHHIE